VSGKRKTPRKPERPWRIEPVPRAEPDLNRLATVLAHLAMDRAKAEKKNPGNRRRTTPKAGAPS
jgi:hypothetical protein